MQASATDAGFPFSAQEHRQLVQALLSAGVLGSGDFLVSQRAAGANFTLDVAAGKAAVVGSSVAAQGSYLITNDAPVTGVVVPAAPASGTRTHRVILKVRDRAHDGAVAADVYDAVVQVLEDTGTGTPALPGSAIPLALVAIPAGTTSITNANITDQRTRAYGARLPALNYEPGTPLAPANFSLANTTCSLVIPAVGWDRNVVVHAMLLLNKSDGSAFDVGIARDFGAPLAVTASTVVGRITLTPSYNFVLPARQTTTVTSYSVRVSGTGTATAFADSLLNRLMILTTPV